MYGMHRHKLRIDVITHIPTLANGPPFAAVCLLPLLSRNGPSTEGIPVVSQHPDIRTFYWTGTRSTSLWWWIPRIPRWICGMGFLLGSAVVGSLLRCVPGVARKNFIAKSLADPIRSPQR